MVDVPACHVRKLSRHGWDLFTPKLGMIPRQISWMVFLNVEKISHRDCEKEVTTQQLSPVTHSYSIGLLVDIKIVEIEDTQKMSELSHVLWPYQMLVGGLEPWNFMTFHNIGNGIIIPTDEVIFFRGVGIPPTSMSLFKYWT